MGKVQFGKQSQTQVVPSTAQQQRDSFAYTEENVPRELFVRSVRFLFEARILLLGKSIISTTIPLTGISSWIVQTVLLIPLRSLIHHRSRVEFSGDTHYESDAELGLRHLGIQLLDPLVSLDAHQVLV